MTAANFATTETPAEVRSIQYLRGVAALGVLVYHATDRAGFGFGVGAAGVDVFFVISGFIMWVVTAARPPSPAKFLLRRVQRIVPLYWGLTLAVAAVALAAPFVFPNMRVTAEHLLLSLFFIPHYDAAGEMAPLIVPGWTLNYEMFFYLIFAAALLAWRKLRPWLLSMALVGLVSIRPLGDAENPLWATYTNPLLLEFLAGVWLGKAWTDSRLPGARVGWLLMVAGVLGFVAATVSGLDVEPVRVLVWGLPALLLVAGAVSVECGGRVPHLPPLRLLGDASYSIYLVHGLAVSAVFRVLQMAGIDSPLVFVPMALAGGILAGLVAYQLVERPMVRFFKKGGQRRISSASARPTGSTP